MHDPVADVLAERAAGQRGFGAALIVSVILHAAGSAAAIYSAFRRPPAQPVSTLNIRFAPVRTARPAPVTPAAAVRPKPAAPRIEEPRPQPPKPPAKKAEPPKNNAAPPSPFGRSTKQAGEVASAPPRAAPPAAATAGITSEVAQGQAGVTGLEGGDFPYTLYLDRMKNLIGSRWLRPQTAGEAKTIVYFQVERDGTIRNAAVTTASGNGNFDRAALRAVLEASPLPPLPFGYSGTYLGVHLTFR
jgi:TonB family protein